MFKNLIRRSAQQLLGFNRYLFLFARFNIFRIKVLKGEEAFRFFMGLIPPQGDILDIGANIGINTTILAQKFPGKIIHAFEPITENYQTLESITGFNKLSNVRIYKTALGDENGNIEMSMPNHKGSKMQGWSRISNDEERGEKYIVPIQQLDQISSLQNNTISALKIDVENFEYYVLKGGESLIRKNKPVIFCELWNDEKRDWCFEFLIAMGYKVMIYGDKKLVPFNGQDALNYFFLP